MELVDHIIWGFTDEDPEEAISRAKLKDIHRISEVKFMRQAANKLDRRFTQLRAGKCPLLRGCYGKGQDRICQSCHEGREETVQHYWYECPAWHDQRLKRGFQPMVECVGASLEYIRTTLLRKGEEAKRISWEITPAGGET